MTKPIKETCPGIFALLRAQSAMPRGPVKPTLFARPLLRVV